MADATVYDVSIGSHNFFMASSAERPYIRQTAPYRKDQSDNSNEAGEQSLTGWWFRSQASFHLGAGIKYYEPSQDSTVKYRFDNSMGVDVWTPGEARLLDSTTAGHDYITVNSPSNIQSVSLAGNNYILTHDGYDVDIILDTGTVTHFIDYIAGPGVEPVYAVCNDGTYAYYVTNKLVGGSPKWHMFKKQMPSAGATETQLIQASGNISSGAYMRFLKDRIVLCINNTINVITTSTTVEPTNAATGQAYVSPSTETRFIGAAASPTAIFVGGYNGATSFIVKLTQDATTKEFTGSTVAAELPRGEIIKTLEYYLGYLLIGTSKGLRVAEVASTGEILYGPLLTDKPVWQFACSGNYVWAATRIRGIANPGATTGEMLYPGTIRIDLSNQIEPLRFPWANDIYFTSSGADCVGVGFFGTSDKLCITSTAGGSSAGIGAYAYQSTTKVANGYLLTGKIRFNTLEKKLFYSIKDSAKYQTNSTLTITAEVKNESSNPNPYTLESYTTTAVWSGGNSTGNADHSITGFGSTSELQFLFNIGRESSNTTIGTVFKGYQIKALPASPRQRLLQYPLYCFDSETDKYNKTYGYPGRAYTVLSALEATEGTGQVLTVTDRRTGESFSGMIEEVTFKSETPPDKRFNGFGGILTVTVRKI